VDQGAILWWAAVERSWLGVLRCEPGRTHRAVAPVPDRSDLPGERWASSTKLTGFSAVGRYKGKVAVLARGTSGLSQADPAETRFCPSDISWSGEPDPRAVRVLAQCTRLGPRDPGESARRVHRPDPGPIGLGPVRWWFVHGGPVLDRGRARKKGGAICIPRILESAVRCSGVRKAYCQVRGVDVVAEQLS